MATFIPFSLTHPLSLSLSHLQTDMVVALGGPVTLDGEEQHGGAQRAAPCVLGRQHPRRRPHLARAATWSKDGSLEVALGGTTSPRWHDSASAPHWATAAHKANGEMG
jgi:hypothetical protein